MFKPVFFSCYGSYMSIVSTLFKKKKNNSFIDEKAMVIRSDHGRSSNRNGSDKNALFLKPTVDNQLVEYDYDIDFNKITINHGKGNVGITFATDDVIIIKGKGHNCGLIIDNSPSAMSDNIISLTGRQGQYFIVNSYKSETKYLVYATKGIIKLEQNYKGDLYLGNNEPLQCKLYVSAKDDEYQVVIQEIEHNSIKVSLNYYDFDECCQRMLNEFNKFYSKFVQPQYEWENVYKIAVYNIWACINKKNGLLQKDIISAGSEVAGNWSTNVCFAALGVYKAHPQLALDQILVFFNLQDEIGCIPGSMSDDSARWAFLKAPVQGLFLKYFLSNMETTRIQKLKIYNYLSKLVEFWLYYRDSNEDGICEYNHGNECGLDNVSVFDNFVATDSPDLTTFIIKDIELLSELALDLNMYNESKIWNEKANKITKKALEYFVINNNVTPRMTESGEIIETKSLLPYIFLSLNQRLPVKLRDSLIASLKKEFCSKYGLTTESKLSSKYSKSGCRGPVWYHSVIIIDAINDCGYENLAKEIATGFCLAIQKNGCYVTHDGDTAERIIGKGFTNQANVCTSSVFIYLYTKYVLNYK